MTPSLSPPTRRRLLAVAGAGVGAGLAGCLAPRAGSHTYEPPEDVGTSLPYDETYPDDDAITMFRGGLRRLGYYPDETAPESPSINWRAPVNYAGHNAAKASPLLSPDGETVVVPADTGRIHAFGPKGRHRWVTETPATRQGFHATPVIADGVAYLGGYDGANRGQEAAMYAIDVATGEVLWRTEEMDGSVAIGSSAGYWDGYLYVIVEYRNPIQKGALWVFDAETGAPLSSDDRIEGMPHPTVAIDPDAGRLLSGSNDGVVYCWEFPSLEFAWEFETGAEVKGPIATYDGSAFVGSWDGNVYRIGLADGEEEWRFETGSVVMSAPGIGPERGTVYVGSDDHHVYALDAATGDQRWATDVQGRVMGAVTVTADAVLAGTTAGELCALEKETGELRWWVEAAGQVTSEPVPRDGRIYFAERADVLGYFEEGEETKVETPGHVYCLIGD
ncbi:PQQ-binding-like beta-propeller repeat protein [Saliphagus infecundisoli]|uniref:PQQ-binding-like beta-propeller repeat protein n=1 Tax=Saliphagus infecundisoli TaxID=1849069 RepID=A0ABD5Q9M0_9EURY|nr:PQQ-binding-like beta-propeller repeat protein [Saliphagus infecundisoli]